MSHKTQFNAKAMHDKLGIATDKFAEFMLASRQLAATKIDTTKARSFVESFMFDADKDFAEQTTQSKNKADKIMSLFNGLGMGSKMDSADGTLWGLTNAFTEFVDHHAAAHTADARLSSALFDKGDTLKTQVFAQALELV